MTAPLRRLAPVWLALALTACAPTEKSSELAVSDFAKPAATPATQPASPASVNPVKPAPGAAASTPAPPTTPAEPAPPPPPDASDAAIEREIARLPKPTIVASAAPSAAGYTVDAMVGQVNGRALYTQSVFEPIHEQLAALGRTLPRATFRVRAKELINKRLDEIVTDALILGEAERDLSEMEKYGLQRLLKEEREELLRKWGSGSEFVANQNLIEKTGKTLDQKVEERRAVLLVQRYMRAKLFPKINVTRKDIERYYFEHEKEFNPPPGRVVRVIRATDNAAADRVEAALAQGTPFQEVAASKNNAFRARDAGLMPEASTGDEVFTVAELNDALKKLAAGKHSQRVRAGNDSWWVMVESITTGKTRTLRDVQLDIEELLKRQRYQYLSSRYRQKLFTEGSYNPLEEMGASLLQVAMSRYAFPE